jgi:acetyl-CoA C-acetyltransferase
MVPLPVDLGPLGPRAPVLVGVGTASADAEASELMIRAVVDAGTDTGRPDIVGMADRIVVPQGSWAYPDPARLVADGAGCPTAETHLYELGIPQQTLINDALAAIAEGRSQVVVVVGGEAKRWERERAGSTEPTVNADQGVPVPEVVHRRQGPVLEPVEVANRLWEPVQQYAMIENALRAAEGRSIVQQRADVAALWARFNQVARSNPDAAFPEPLDAEQIAAPSASNRPLAFPYNKWHSTQWTVNQAAALIICSAECAARLGVATDRWVFPLVGIESSHAVSILRRLEPHTWPAMEVLGRAASDRIGRALADAEIVETYSCFPAAVRVQQRALGLGLDSTPTVTGGMAFAGGPFNNFVLQATATVGRALREGTGSIGVVTTVSGLLTKPGLGAWSGRPDGQPPLVADLAGPAEARTAVIGPGAVVETLGGFRGDATVVTYTVTYEAMEPVRSVVLCDTTDGRRCVAISEDPDLASQAVRRELVGARVHIDEGSFHLT